METLNKQQINQSINVFAIKVVGDLELELF